MSDNEVANLLKCISIVAMTCIYYIGPDIHKEIIAYCIKTANGRIVGEGDVNATRCSRMLGFLNRDQECIDFFGSPDKEMWVLQARLRFRKNCIELNRGTRYLWGLNGKQMLAGSD